MPNYSGLWTRQAQLQATSVPNWPAPPGAPTGISASVASATSVTVSFTAPTNTGIPAGITGYRVTSSPGGITATGSASPITVTGLTTGQAYTFTVAAQNASGYGPESAASNSVTPDNYYIENVFSTYLYTGNGSTQTITNGINLSGNGGLVWIKERAGIGWPHVLTDTVRGAGNSLSSDNTGASVNNINNLSSFNNNGFSLGTGAVSNYNTSTYASWTFREQPKFFDIVTYTGNGTAGRQIAHNLGSVPGFIIVKRLNSADEWTCYHRSVGATKWIALNQTAAPYTSSSRWNDTEPTSSVFTVGVDTSVNSASGTYVAYLFAHDAGGFGASGTDNVISCGSYTGTGSSVSVTLGYEPQWVMIKRTDSTGNWVMLDNMRGTPYSQAPSDLYANTSGAEQQNFGSTSTGFITNPTGFGWNDGSLQINANGGTYIYIAIRRGPMKTPTDATKVFKPSLVSGVVSTGYVVDSNWLAFITGGVSYTPAIYDRLGGVNYLVTSSTNAETSGANLGWDTNSGLKYSWNSNQAVYMFARAPSFFDEVFYVGTGVARTVNHNLGVVPEMIIVKARSAGTANWQVYHSAYGPTLTTQLNLVNAQNTGTSVWNSTMPTASVFTIGTSSGVNSSSTTYVAYLFASCPGVSKVGSYTGTGTTQQINCGFTSGSRFVLIKRTDSSGDWYVWDSARGIVAGNDPYFLLNSTAAEVTNTDYVDTYAAGFEISSTAPAAINANGGTYIYLAIA